ncbi:MAG: thioredoxin family protein [Parvularculaceae bacterium]|nr:thioredoxin family protein [Parvularculaceae bacterium]
MMKFAVLLLAASVLAAPAVAGPEIDAPAPAFSAMTASGKSISLADFKGKPVVLEWTNDGCPFVKKHYETGNMQETQTAAKEAGMVWISVISSAPGKQGHADPTRANQLTVERGAKPDFVILDESGEVGRAYDAKTTPHMFLIDADGVLRYDGAIDDQPSANHATVDGASNYVLLAINSVKNGEPVTLKRTKPYGCSVKYGS